MTLDFNRKFKKKYKKLFVGEREKCDQRLAFFIKDPYNRLLDNHALGGKYKGYRSIDITGDLRAVYEPITQDRAYFIIVDTHSNLYSGTNYPLTGWIL